MTVRTDLERRLTDIPGLDRRPSRYGGALAYFVGDREIAHFHGEERMDLRLTRELIQLRKAEGGFDDRVRTRGPSAEWLSVRLVAARDIPFALQLVEEAVRANG